jgi:hypothetical protein
MADDFDPAKPPVKTTPDWLGVPAAAGYAALDEYLLGLPSFFTQKVLGSEAYKSLQALKNEQKAATAAGTGAGLAASLVGPGALVKGGLAAAKSVPTALKWAEKLAKLEAPIRKAAATGLASGVFHEGANQDLSTVEGVEKTLGGGAIGAAGAALPTALVSGIGKVIATKAPNIQNELLARAEKATEAPLNTKLAKAGVTGADAAYGTKEAERIVAEAAGKKPEIRTGQIADKLPKTKEALEWVLDTYHRRGPEALEQFAAADVDDLAKMIVMDIRKAGSDISEEAAIAAAHTLKSRSAVAAKSDITQAAQSAAKTERSVTDTAKKALGGMVIGGVAGGTLPSIPGVISGEEDFKVDLPGLIGGAALGLSPSALGKAGASMPAVKLKSKVDEAVLTDLATGANKLATATGAEAARIVPDVVKALSPKDEKVIEAAKPEEVDMTEWKNFVEDTAYNSWVAAGSPGKFSAWLKSTVQDLSADYDPIALANAESSVLSERDRQAILRDYRAQQALDKIDKEHFFRNKSTIESLFGEDATGQEKSKLENEMIRSILTPKALQTPNKALDVQIRRDINEIAGLNATTEQKYEMFLDKLRQYYGYNPEYLTRLGLGKPAKKGE